MTVTPQQPDSAASAARALRPPAGMTGARIAAIDRDPVVDPAVERSRAYLSRVAEAPAPAVVDFVAQIGPVDAAARIARGDVPAQVERETGDRRAADRADADLAAATAAGVRLLFPEHPHWPHHQFDDLADAGSGHNLAPPLALWVRGPGRLDQLATQAIAVIGARAATGYGVHTAGEIAAGLATHGHCVVSGAALGVDGAAHRGALAARSISAAGATIAVLACGADRSYPSAHEGLLQRIAATGLIVSEYPPNAVPARHRFIARNRLSVALSAGVVVVEASIRSGAMQAAADARTLARPLMAVPGPVTSSMSAGCHQLLRDGAALVTSAQDVVDVLSADPATG